MTQRILYWNVSNYVGTGYNYQHSRAFIYHPHRHSPPSPTHLPTLPPPQPPFFCRESTIHHCKDREKDRQTDRQRQAD